MRKNAAARGGLLNPRRNAVKVESQGKSFQVSPHLRKLPCDNRTAAAEAVRALRIYGTAEAVPFVQRALLLSNESWGSSKEVFRIDWILIFRFGNGDLQITGSGMATNSRPGVSIFIRTRCERGWSGLPEFHPYSSAYRFDGGETYIRG